jgi:hypothetical protein
VTIACNLPFHVYGYVDKRFLSQHEVSGWEEAVWFAITTSRNRAAGLTVLLENGAVYRQLPPHAFAFSTDAVPEWSLRNACAWDCFGGDVQVIEYTYLTDLTVELLPTGPKGSYLFTIEFDNDGFSKYPAQSKCLHCIRTDNGRLTMQPNNYLRWTEMSFTDHSLPLNYLRRQQIVYGTED